MKKEFCEVIGVVASLLIIIAFSCDDVKKIRILDSLGALLYIIYGLLIGSISNMFLNSVLLSIQLYKLFGIKGDYRGR